MKPATLSKRITKAVTAFILPIMAFSQSMVPAPNSYRLWDDADFQISPSTVVAYADPAQLPIVEAFNQMLQSAYGFKLATVADTGMPKQAVILRRDGTLTNPEGYLITITGTKIVIDHADRGLMPALATLLQMLPPKPFTTANIGACRIEDAPRFSYRGMHLDVSRHFMPVPVVKKFIDQLALFKFNTFHWHLTDDQGWRIEIKKYPKLTEVGAWRGGTIVGRYPGTGNTNQPHGGFYTQNDVKDVVAYAAARQITIIPEIEMPGHSSAAIAAYPWLSCFPQEPTSTKNWQLGQATRPTTTKQVQESWGVFEDVFCPSDSTFQFLETVLDEVLTLFPGKYIHIGGDECPKEAWKRSAFCQNLIKQKGLKDEHGLQSYFIGRMEKYLNGRGREIIGWDEILEGGLAPNASVMSWRGEAGGIEAAKMGHTVVMTPGGWVYFDHSQTKFEDSVTIGGYTTLEKTYSYAPVPKSLTPKEAAYVMGAQGNVWTEYINNPKKLEYMVFPRMAALSEVLWSSERQQSWSSFAERLPNLLKTLDHWGINYSQAFADMQETMLPQPKQGYVLWQVSAGHPSALVALTTPQDAAFEKLGATKGNLPNSSKKLADNAAGDSLRKLRASFAVPLNKTGTYTAERQAPGLKKQVIVRKVTISKSTGKLPKLTHKPQNQNVMQPAGFALVDGLRGTTDQVHGPQWLGWQGKDCEAVFAIGKPIDVSRLVYCGLEKTGDWIYKPSQITVWTSTDGKKYTKQLSIDTKTPTETERNGLFKFELKFKPVLATHVKVVASSPGKIPMGQPGAEQNAWIFADEIELY
ncbi:MAG: beta-N-acetylhexosaminidase [Bacteroidetes bacterium]|nr:MAG: beta-N-acetylhexosaminidase [Bacteroidota bacterium]